MKRLQQPCVHKLVDGANPLKGGSRLCDDSVRNPLGPAELLEVEGEHLDLAQIPNGHGTDILELHSQQRARDHEIKVLAIAVHQELESSDNLGALLCLVDEHKCLARNQIVFREGGDAKK